MPWRMARVVALGATLGAVATALGSPSAGAEISMVDNTPFPPSAVITGARWTTPRYDPPPTQYGDIFATTWAADGGLYSMVNDGGLLDKPYRWRPRYYPARMWKNFLVRITGRPPRVRFRLVGRGQALGLYYSDGLTAVNGRLYATQVADWNWRAFALFRGLAGVAYSRDGRRWVFPRKRFPRRAGNLNWVMEGRDRPNPDGWLYAIASEREFNASKLFLGRARPWHPAVTDPARWRWADGTDRGGPRWTTDLQSAAPVLQWRNHITYPQMTWVPAIGRYLLSFSYSYYDDDSPKTFTGGAELVVLEAPHPWGPFSFAFREPYWGPSNGYGGSFPLKWQEGRDLWMYWAANWDKQHGGCLARLDCSGKYGFNMRRLHLSVPGAP